MKTFLAFTTGALLGLLGGMALTTGTFLESKPLREMAEEIASNQE